MWWKKHQRPLLAVLILAAVLTAAFLRGGQPTRNEGPAAAVTSQPAAPVQETVPAAEPPAGEAAESGEPAAAPEPPESESVPPEEEQAPVPETESAPAAAQQPVRMPECTVSISCASILENMDLCLPEKTELVPEDGWILQPTAVPFTEGESVFDVLQRVCRQNRIHMEYMDTPVYGSAYIEGIHNLYEFDVGELSGWMYSVNGSFPNYGCSQAILADGDVVCWVYTCDYGADVGGNNFAA
ncbi:DUF4430 domain-containing protein [Dysosmobacter sp.]|uniref:DUF4430 domain-containing protein n=1 Tax=Dysosmobacter sp. TaxID=2591382 RepID=UPI002A8EA004|nr:DUF4430 domain-containing protein [Dysosmobacter sp.]MDY3282410.1 DUF4430 domain-containing protein [Dysosmobacter sp.]